MAHDWVAVAAVDGGWWVVPDGCLLVSNVAGGWWMAIMECGRWTENRTRERKRRGEIWSTKTYIKIKIEKARKQFRY